MHLKSALLLAASAATAFACGAGAPATSSELPTVPLVRLASIARGMASGLGDPHVRTAWVIATTKNAAEAATDPGAVPPDPANPRAYLIVIRGRFVCRSCSMPSGVEPPHGRVAYDIWVPGRGTTDDGLLPRISPGLPRLGHVVTLRVR